MNWLSKLDLPNRRDGAMISLGRFIEEFIYSYTMGRTNDSFKELEWAYLALFFTFTIMIYTRSC